MQLLSSLFQGASGLRSSKLSFLILSWTHFFLSYSWKVGGQVPFHAKPMGVLVLISFPSCVFLFRSLPVAS